ncbi:MAG: helix-turn-helix domain-containing protein [Ktedonobacterales bacterium]
MQVQRAYKTELSLNDGQVTACRRHAGAARWGSPSSSGNCSTRQPGMGREWSWRIGGSHRASGVVAVAGWMRS